MSYPKAVYQKLSKRKPYSLGFSRHALSFPYDCYVQTGVGVVPQQPLTLMVWFKPTVIAGDILINSRHQRVAIRCSPSLHAWYYDGGALPALSGGTPLLNKWNFAVYTKDAVNGAFLYLNGVLVDSNAAHNTPIVFSVDDCWLGTDTGLGGWYRGLLDGAAIYNRAISSLEIRRNMLNYHRLVRNGLVMWFPMEEGNGLTLYDQSGLGNNGSLLPVATPPLWVNTRKWELRAESRL